VSEVISHLGVCPKGQGDARRPARDAHGGSLLIQCVGNRLRRDDGAALVVADRLRAGGLGSVVREYWGEGAELMQAWEAVDRVLLVDAACSGATPGTLHRFDPLKGPLPRDFFYYSTHRFGVAEAVELAKVLGLLPPRLILCAIEGGCFSAGDGLTEPVALAAARLADEILSDSSCPMGHEAGIVRHLENPSL